MSIGRKQYPFDLIEPKWQGVWDQQQTFRAWNPGEVRPQEHPFTQRHGTDSSKLPPKYYVLDMFPYPSGAGLHVGHPEGYTATDILARYRRAAGFNVLHPMGWDAFGLPAEQYAIKTGQHPRVTTEANVANFKRQIKSLGFSYDWSREVDTTDPDYFKWTQWIFLKLYNSWFNPKTNKGEPIETLPYPPELKTEGEKRAYRDSKRLAFVSEAPVNWCPELGTVLANEEVIDGKSEVGGFPVVRKPMRQWMLRITAYAEKLLNDLDTIDWSDSLKEMQRNWIGRSEGAEVKFLHQESGKYISVFTTRPDTLFGATYMVLSPEHPLVNAICTEASYLAVADYQKKVASKSDLERTELAKEKTGVFTGGYVVNPVNGEKIPVWTADYVLASYGTGAIMAVPGHDERDFEFARKFGITIKPVVAPSDEWLLANAKNLIPETAHQSELLATSQAPEANRSVEKLRSVYMTDCGLAGAAFCEIGVACNSANKEISLDGLPTQEAKKKITAWLEEKGLGKKTINYKLRDWLFSRQRYWGEPFPIIWRDGHHEALPESALPLLPPDLTDFKPTSTGEPPLARAKNWVNLPDGAIRETNTMPQWAGSCWYYLRYLDARNGKAFVDKDAENYWMGTGDVTRLQGYKVTQEPQHDAKGVTDITLQRGHGLTPGVDLYVGGTEHAVLHLLYARFWHKVLFDLGYVSTSEPFFKLVNQGLILGEDGQKMSKSRGNVVNPDDILKDYGADAFRMYEMFLGPLEMVKPWNTKNVEGVYRFLGKVWRLFVDEVSETAFEQALTTSPQRGAGLLDEIKLSAAIQDSAPTPEQLKALHAAIKKVTEDLDGLRFNTAISALMVFINDAMKWEVKPRSVLCEFLTLLQPFAPHLAEELFSRLNASPAGQPATLAYVPWPKYDPALLVTDTLELPVQVNGKLRDLIVVQANATQAEIEAAALACEKIKPFMEGKTVKKIIIVPKRLVNIVVA